MTNLTKDRRLVFYDAEGTPYRPVKDGGSGRSVFKIKPKGASNRAEDAIHTEDWLEVARAMLIDGLPARCQPLPRGQVNYLKFGAHKLVSYELDPELARILGIPDRSSAGDDMASISRRAVEAAMDAYDSYRTKRARSEIFDAFGEPRDYWVRSSRERENRVYPTKPLIGFILRRTVLNGGWGQKTDAASRLHNAGFIIVDQNDQPIEQPASYEHLMEGADRIRLCALNYFIEPARERAARQISIRAGDLAAAMGLQDVFPNICQALGGEKFQKLAQVPPPTSTEPNPSSSTVFTFTLNAQPEAHTAMKTLNTILYGPPGTGKTYATFRKAVEICDGVEAVEAMDGDALKARYAELREAGRIGFVTFHQSYSYEEFVEGLRPEGGADDAGFTLQPRHGALREIAELAQGALQFPPKTATPASDRHALSLEGRAIYKMSIGRAGVPAEEYLFEEAVTEGHTLLGFESLDFTDPRYEDPENILQICQAEGTREGEVTRNSGSVAMLNTFRNELKVGDIIVVSKGNSVIRAIGEVTGDYYHVPRPEGVYTQRRSVNWLWVNRSGLPVGTVYDGNFTMRSIYPLDPKRLNFDALQALIDGREIGSGGDAEPFVLVIDEINRANISKVFGELITLLEEDKRAGAENEVSVRLPYSGDDFTLPANLYVLGTMNTADRSIALLDTALRRRFHFEETPPRPDLLETTDGIDLPLLLTRLNQRIEYLVDRDHLIGHAFFNACQTRDDVDTVMRRKVLPLLAEYFHEDWERIVAVLGGDKQRFIERQTLEVPPGLNPDMEEARYRYTVRESFPQDAYAGLQT